MHKNIKLSIITIKILCIILFFVLLVRCDILVDDGNCGKTFNETERNDGLDAANNYNIILKPGCTITLTGVHNTQASIADYFARFDYFRINTGSAKIITYELTWNPATEPIAIMIMTAAGIPIDYSIVPAGSASSAIVKIVPDQQYVTNFILVDTDPNYQDGLDVGASDYKLIIRGE